MTLTFAKTWLLKQYKTHREHVLLDIERARLPEAQEDAARYRDAKQVVQRIQLEMAPFEKQIAELPENQAEKNALAAYTARADARRASERASIDTVTQNNELRLEESASWIAYMTARTSLYVARNGLLRQINRLRTPEYMAALRIQKNVGRPAVPCTAGATAVRATTSWSFVMKCSRDACEGFVGTNWKCGLCDVQFCKECGEPQDADSQHLCNPETRSTHIALRKEAKPCPKCAAMISKIDGCDQMWCTQCQTAFSWRTGQIETSHVHNPHYFQWMRQNGGAPAPRPVGDCLNMTPQEVLDQVIHYGRDRSQWNVIEWARLVRHFMWMQRQHQHTLRERQDDDWRRQLRVKRLVHEVDDKAWKERLQRGEKATQKEYAVVQILDLFIETSIELLRNTLVEDADSEAIIAQLKNLRNYCNIEMGKIQHRFNNQVEYIHDTISETEYP